MKLLGIVGNPGKKFPRPLAGIVINREILQVGEHPVTGVSDHAIPDKLQGDGS